MQLLCVLVPCVQKYERDARRLAQTVIKQWKRYVRRKKQGDPMVPPRPPAAMGAVVEEAKEQATETTCLLC